MVQPNSVTGNSRSSIPFKSKRNKKGCPARSRVDRLIIFPLPQLILISNINLFIYFSFKPMFVEMHFNQQTTCTVWHCLAIYFQIINLQRQFHCSNGNFHNKTHRSSIKLAWRRSLPSIYHYYYYYWFAKCNIPDWRLSIVINTSFIIHFG